MKKILLILAATALLAQCTHSLREEGASVPAPLSLLPANFEVSGDTVGEACVTRVFFVAWGRLFSSESGRGASLYSNPLDFSSGLLTSEARSEAMNNALAKVEGSSYFAIGQVRAEASGLWPAFGRECVTVHGRALTIKNTARQ
ncbi:MAG: hypothetical protein K1X75_01060 [Leptospirales bacterium]|nr:hypothetical protein [Leptospirales bacterium]